MPGRRREPRPLQRKVATRAPRKTLVVFCEGEQTEPAYLDALKREPSVRQLAAVDLRVERGHGGAVPTTLVRMAAEAQRRSTAEEGEVDEFWCVFDVEWPTNHPDLAKALDTAHRNGIRVAVSNPCFELWLVLHFQDHTAWLDNDAARRLRRSLDRARGKGLDAAVYMPLLVAAARRAELLERFHAQNGTRFPRDNPSSGMHHLLAAVTQPPKP